MVETLMDTDAVDTQSDLKRVIKKMKKDNLYKGYSNYKI